MQITALQGDVLASHFRLTNSLKPKDIHFTVVREKEKQRIASFEKIEPQNVQHFSLFFFLLE